MATASELLRQGRRDEVWRKYCGFLDLSLQEFMEIQERLLMWQVQLLGQCELGQIILRGKTPRTVEEFREVVPLSSYSDYLPYLDSAKPDNLPATPYVWARTSGRSTEYECKWAPYSREMVTKVGEFAVAAFLLASCSEKGDVQLEEHDTCLYTLAPPPYFTGAIVARGLAEQLNPDFIPPLDKGADMEFGERIEEGFRLGLRSRIDLFYGLSSVLVAVAEQLAETSSGFSADMLHPTALFRGVKGLIRSKVSGRGLLPRDLWRVRGIVAGGMDTAFYSDAIETYWGRRPLEGYGGTELGGVALQAWNYKAMSFLPDSGFLEFIPEEDFFKSKYEPDYDPATLRLDEVTAGVYELVITNFHGGIYTRYRTGDLVEIVAMGDDELGIDTPQVVFHARADGVIDVGGFTRLTEKAMWQAIEEAGVPYKEWTVRKEYAAGRPTLHLYLELKGQIASDGIGRSIHEKLKEKDPGYSDLESLLGLDPLRVTILPPNAFASYTAARQLAGAELAHLKPPRVNATDEVIHQLLNVGSTAQGPAQ